MLRVRIELTTLRLWDLRAAYCATEAGQQWWTPDRSQANIPQDKRSPKKVVTEKSDMKKSPKKNVNRDSYIASSPISQSSFFEEVRYLILASSQRKLRG